jgi:rhodanese-related sulfurtransferase
MDRIFEFTGNHPVLVAGLIGSFLWLIFFELKQKAAGLVNVDTATAISLINDGAMVLDLRSKEAFDQGHIVNAKNIPLDEFDARRDSAVGSKARSVVTVCDSGVRSSKAVNSLRQSGHEAAFNLKGGMNAWTQAGLPVVTGKKTKSKSKS